MAIAVIVATVVAVIVLCVVLARQGSVGRLSEEASTARDLDREPSEDGGRSHGSAHQWSGVMERPAGPDAESMDPDQPVNPTPPAAGEPH